MILLSCKTLCSLAHIGMILMQVFVGSLCLFVMTD